MKLNKVLALALSGVMAVSMLAGCSGNGSNNGGSNSGEEPVVDNSLTGQVISALSSDNKVTFTSNNTLGTTLQKAIDNAGYSYKDIKSAETTLEKSMMSIDSDLDNAVLLYINDNDDASRENDDKKAQSTFGVIVYDGASFSSDYAVKQLASEIDSEKVMGTGAIKFAADELPTATNDYKDGDSTYYYTFDYTGSMSVVTVSDTVTGQTVYVAAYTITRTPTKVEK